MISSNEERAAELNRLYNEEHLTYEVIGQRYGITRERVRQILVKHGYSTGRPRKPDPICFICGGSYPKTQFRKHCLAAGHGGYRQPKREKHPERNTAIVAEYLNSDLTGDEIAAKHGIQAPSIYPILRRRGIKPTRGGGHYVRDQVSRERMKETVRRKRRTQPPPLEVVLRLAGHSPTAIARHLDVPRYQVYGRLDRWHKYNREVVYPPIRGQATIGPAEPARSGDRPAPDPRPDESLK